VGERIGEHVGGFIFYSYLFSRYALIYIHGFDYNELELNKAKAMRLGRRRANLATCFVRFVAMPSPFENNTGGEIGL
jgi:hypothetical protein